MDSTNATAGGTEEVCDVPANNEFFTHLCGTVILIIFASKIFHSLVGNNLRQPRIVSELAVGLTIGHIPYLRKLVKPTLEDGFLVIENFGSALYMFVLGLEMEPLTILQPPGPEAKIAFAGIFSTTAFFILTYYILNNFGPFRDQMEQIGTKGRAIAAFIIMFNAASSPIITRMITELKLGQSEIGRLAIRSGLANDLFCTFVMAVLVAFRLKKKIDVLIVMGSVVAELIFVKFVMVYLIKLANERNPEGKKMKRLDVTIIMLMVQILCHVSEVVGYDAKVNSFLIGLALPRQGRLSNFLISKLNYVLTSFVLPVYIAMAGVMSHYVPKKGESMGSTMYKMVILSLVSFVGKLIGMVIVCFYYGLHWLEAVTLAVTLSMKGYFHIIFATLAKNRGHWTGGPYLVMLVIVIVSIVYVPFTLSFIIKRVRKIKAERARLMGLQWYNPATELRVTIGLHTPQNVASFMTLIGLMRSDAAAGTVVYAVDMIELTEQIRAAIVYKQGTDSVMVANDEVVEFREQIGIVLDSQMELSGREGITINRSLAISSFSDMHDNICCSAQDTLTVLIVLPFHKNFKSDGSFDEGHSGFRTVNENVLLQSPCSTAILVDRGGLSRSNSNPSTSNASIDIAMVFIGGADDREALACAGMISRHPDVRLLVFRIKQDREMMMAEWRRTSSTESPREVEVEMEADDEYVAGFYDQFVTNGEVEYVEKIVNSAAEAVKALREMERECGLFIVGKGTGRKSMLTAGMIEWCDCPELGPIGDILASSDFPTGASVLVVQQHNPARDSEYISDEFMPL